MNRRQIYRRDLNQIPQALRPAPPVSRAERPEVVLSETYQVSEESPFFSVPIYSDSKNPVYYPSSPDRPFRSSGSSELASLVSSLSSPYSGIHPPHPDAKELTAGGKTYVFVLLRHIRNPKDNELWISSYNSIRRHYTNKIVIIDDNSSLNTVNGKLYQTDVIQSDYAGAGETLPYYYFLMHRWADRMIFLHDTMSLYRPFRPDEVDTDARFHWFFQNKDHVSVSRLKGFLPSLRNHKALLAKIDQADFWRACFGVAMTVSLEVVERLEETYKLFSTMPMMIRNRKDREMAERLVGLIMFDEGIVSVDTCSTFGDIHKYPGSFESSDISLSKYALEQAGYDTAIIKVWRGR